MKLARFSPSNIYKISRNIQIQYVYVQAHYWFSLFCWERRGRWTHRRTCADVRSIEKTEMEEWNMRLFFWFIAVYCSFFGGGFCQLERESSLLVRPHSPELRCHLSHLFKCVDETGLNYPIVSSDLGEIKAAYASFFFFSRKVIRWYFVNVLSFSPISSNGKDSD